MGTKRSREEDLEPSSPESETDNRISDSSDPSATSPDLSNIPTAKIVHLDLQPESGEASSAVVVMKCSLPGHRQTLSFASYADYDLHYNKFHTNRCLECRKNFPTEHFLNCHIEENHDSLVSIKRERGEKTYSCFVEDCDRKCSTPQKRKMHLIDKHMFPQQYDFFIVNDGIDGRSSMLRSGPYRHGHRRRSSAAQKIAEARRQSASLEGDNVAETVAEDEGAAGEPSKSEEDSDSMPDSPKQDDLMEGLTGAMSSLKFVPTSVRFGRGRGRGRGGFSRS